MRKAAPVVFFCFCLATTILHAQTVRVGGESLRANGYVAQGFQYTGPCPVQLKFGWGLLADGPTQVVYRFVRNDGGHTANSFGTYIPGPNRSIPVYDDWRLGANTPQFADYRGWVDLIIESPNPLTKRIGFTLHCE